MPCVTEIRDYIARLAPVELAEDWDNVGLLVNCGGAVDKVLCALDITVPVVEEAVRLGCQLIVCHHPVIFRPLKRLEKGDAVFMLAQHNISGICMHTNLDAAPGGVNDVLAGIFGLTDVVPMEGIGRVGNLPAALTAEQLAALCREKLGAPVRYVSTDRPIRRMALLGGAGGDFVLAAIEAGADCLITGEASHHHGIEAARKGFCLVAAGHFETEWPVTGYLAESLRKQFGDLTVYVSEQDASPFAYY